MPATKIHLRKGLQKTVIVKMRELLLDTIIDVLKLPADDRNVFISEYEPDFFQMKAPYELFIEISMFSGRTNETKRKLFQAIVNTMESNNIFKKEQIFIILNEQPMENWGIRGGIPANDINLGFQVNV